MESKRVGRLSQTNMIRFEITQSPRMNSSQREAMLHTARDAVLAELLLSFAEVMRPVLTESG